MSNVKIEKYSFGDGSSLKLSFNKRGLHSVSEPALILTNKDGTTLELYFRDGKLHRKDGPAIDAFFKDAGRAALFFQDNCRQPYPVDRKPKQNISKK